MAGGAFREISFKNEDSPAKLAARQGAGSRDFRLVLAVSIHGCWFSASAQLPDLSSLLLSKGTERCSLLRQESWACHYRATLGLASKALRPPPCARDGAWPRGHSIRGLGVVPVLEEIVSQLWVARRPLHFRGLQLFTSVSPAPGQVLTHGRGFVNGQ